jgi:hypothetical protein
MLSYDDGSAAGYQVGGHVSFPTRSSHICIVNRYNPRLYITVLTQGWLL